MEWVTLEDLERVIQHPSEHNIQAFLVLLRILSGKSWGALKSLLGSNHELTRYRDELMGQRDFVKLLDISQATLKSLFLFEEKEFGFEISGYVRRSIYYLVETLVNLERINPNLLTVETIRRFLDLITDSDRIFYDEDGKALQSPFNHFGHLETLLRLVTLLASPPPNRDEWIDKEELKKFVQRSRYDHMGQSLLHLACNDRHIPSLPEITLLIDSGIHPTADVNGDTPLHFLARLAHLNYIDGELVASVANLLLETGAHLDQRNNSRMTAMKKSDVPRRTLKDIKRKMSTGMVRKEKQMKMMMMKEPSNWMIHHYWTCLAGSKIPSRNLSALLQELSALTMSLSQSCL